MIAEAVQSSRGEQQNNLLIFLENQRMEAAERERIRQEERADERRREDNRFFMMMSMFRSPSHLMSSAPTIQSPMTQSSAQSSQNQVHEFDGQDFIERELARRTYGV
jgi:hypothetical protein